MVWTAWITMIVGVVGSVAAVLVGAIGLGWRVRSWISDLNANREISYQGLKGYLHDKLAARDVRDQERHVENLERFSTINERLARMGNGRVKRRR